MRIPASKAEAAKRQRPMYSIARGDAKAQLAIAAAAQHGTIRRSHGFTMRSATSRVLNGIAVESNFNPLGIVVTTALRKVAAATPVRSQTLPSETARMM